MVKNPVIKIRGEFQIVGDVNLKVIADTVAEIQERLRELGQGEVKLLVPRGEYSV